MASTHQFDVAKLFGAKDMVAVVTGGRSTRISIFFSS